MIFPYVSLFVKTGLEFRCTGRGASAQMVFQSSSSTTIRKKTPCHGKVQRFACYLTDSYRQIFSKYGFLKKKIYIYNANNCNSSCRVNINLQLRFSAQKCPANPCNRSGPRLQMKTRQCHGQKIGRLHLQWGWQKFQVTLAANKVGGKKPDQFRTGQDTSCNCHLEAWTQTTCVHYPKMDSEEKYRKTLRIYHV